MPPSMSRAQALAHLGLNDDATLPEVVAAFRRLARATHPDVASPQGSTADAGRDRADFSAIRDAYRRLVDDRSSVPSRSASSPRNIGVPPRHTSGPKLPPIVAGPVRIRPLGSGAGSSGGSDA